MSYDKTRAEVWPSLQLYNRSFWTKTLKETIPFILLVSKNHTRLQYDRFNANKLYITF